MFSRKIIESDKFLDMDLNAQLLYFHLCMYADDDGFVDNPKTLIRCIGADADGMDVLINNGFVIALPTGIVVITHWKLHNYIAKDRYRPSIHIEEKAMLKQDSTNTYYLALNTN